MSSSDSLKGVEMTETLKLYHAKDDTFKGIILNHKDEHVMSNFPLPQDYILPDDLEKFSQEVGEVYPITVFAAIEGTLIRVYYYDDHWYISTSSRIDAYTSFWSTRQSFGSQFEDFVCSITGTPLEVFLCSLDKAKKYFFLLPTVGTNRLGKLPNEEPKRIYLVGIEEDDKKLKYGLELDKTEHNAWSYLDEYSVDSLDHLQQIVCEQDQNYILYLGDRVVKCVSQAYKDRCDLRNNEPNIIYRYIELLKNNQLDLMEKFKNMYPEVNFSGYVEKRLFLMSKYIHSSYIARYIKKEYVLLPKIYFHIMKKCHQDFLETRGKTTLEKIQQMIMEQEPKVILSLIRNFSVREQES
jgi:hypothetical protein